ncbi:MAG: PIN domain-containing protein [Candidatus Wallbacteria bacterium]|nr:PIN domain-containing protein [Candidatus Wallbacteria bacterium]
MSNPVFVDASALIALADPGDPAHGRAVGFLGHLEGPLATSNLVLLEAASQVAARAGNRQATEMLERLRAESALKIYFVDPELERKGWEHFVRHARKTLTPRQAMAMALMKELGIRMVFTFEEAYREAGFVAVPLTQE